MLKLCLLLNGYRLLQAIDLQPVEINTKTESNWHSHDGIFTWMGLLVKKDYDNTEDVMSSPVLVVLVSDGVAVGVAKQLLQRVPGSCEVMFLLPSGRSWRSDVERITAAPDYPGDSLALVFLVPPAELWDGDFSGLFITWPRSNTAPSPASIVGYELTDGVIRQFQKQAVRCNEDQCANASRGYDYTKYACYREYNVPFSQCKYRSGTALIYRTKSGEYSLFAIGDQACSSCARWVRFHPHREWIQQNIAPSLRVARAHSPMYDYYDDLDQHLIAHMYRGKARNEIQWAWAQEFVKGPCWGARGRNMYREQMHFISRRDGTFGSYALSLYDLILTHFRCVSIWSAPSNRTKVSWLGVKTGFEQDDIDHYVKKVPISTDGKILPKIIFLLDKWRKYHEKDIKVETMEFSFIFDQDFEMEINFWAD